MLSCKCFERLLFGYLYAARRELHADRALALQAELIAGEPREQV